MALWLLTRAGTPLGVGSMQTPDLVRSPRHLCDTIVAAFSLGGWPKSVVAALQCNGQKMQLRARVQKNLIAAWLDSNTLRCSANVDFVLEACLDAATYHLGEPLRGLAAIEEQLRDGDRLAREVPFAQDVAILARLWAGNCGEARVAGASLDLLRRHLTLRP